MRQFRSTSQELDDPHNDSHSEWPASVQAGSIRRPRMRRSGLVSHGAGLYGSIQCGLPGGAAAGVAFAVHLRANGRRLSRRSIEQPADNPPAFFSTDRDRYPDPRTPSSRCTAGHNPDARLEKAASLKQTRRFGPADFDDTDLADEASRRRPLRQNRAEEVQTRLDTEISDLFKLACLSAIGLLGNSPEALGRDSAEEWVLRSRTSQSSAHKLVRPEAAADLALCAILVFLYAAAAQARGTLNHDTAAIAQPLSFPEKFKQAVVNGTTLEGQFGIYDFRRWHNLNKPYPGQPAAKTGQDTLNMVREAQLGLMTKRIYGFSLGARFIYESSLFSDPPISTLEQISRLFLQFNAYGTQFRLGKQLLTTPLAISAQFSGISVVIRPLQTDMRLNHPLLMGQSNTGPQTEAGEYGPEIVRTRLGLKDNYTLGGTMPFYFDKMPASIPHWQIFGAKIDRNVDTDSNNYFKHVAGFWTVGTGVHLLGSAGELCGLYYHYRFQQTESADYGEIGYMMPPIGHGKAQWAPYVNAQAMAAYDADTARIPEGIDGQIYGLKLGVRTSKFNLSVFGNVSPEHPGAFNDGQILHPYTDLAGFLYTDTLGEGIQEIGPGWAAGARVDIKPSDNLNVYAHYVRYRAKHGHYHDFLYSGPYKKITDDSFVGKEVDNQYSQSMGVGMTYDLGGLWKPLSGLIISDDFNVTSFDKNAPRYLLNNFFFYYLF